LPREAAGKFLLKPLETTNYRHGDAIATFSGGGIMSHLKLTLPAVILLGGFLLCSTVSFGKPEYTKATKKACTYCHVNAKASPKELTDAGKYYSEHKSLDGYQDKK
jgi:hypothetical protein